MPMRWLRSLLVTAVLAVGVACIPQTRSDSARFATYNIQWLSEDAHPDRVNRLKNIFRSVNADVIGLQEISSRKALEQFFDSNYTIAIMDEVDEDQEVALVVRKPYRVESYTTLFRGKELDFPFPGKRDVLWAVVVGPTGEKFSVYVLHNKSRGGGRMNTDPQRQMAMGMLAAWIAQRPKEHHVVLGDLNDAPDDVSVNILETGNLAVEGGRVSSSKPLMVNLMEPLYDKDYVTLGLNKVYQDQPLEPIMNRAKSENERFRGKEYRFPDDVLTEGVLFDQILVSPGLAPRAATPMIFSGKDALEGTTGRTSKNAEGRAVYTEKGTGASDHLPVFVDIRG